ncbi:hypothetical protein [Domibacillus epiphyticus]|nr:hypothetical protein [Domibacillus epiphyticus]
MAENKEGYEETFKENVKQIQEEHNQMMEDKDRIPNQQNRMKSVERKL